MERREEVLDSINWNGDYVTLTKVVGGNVIGDSDKYRIDFYISGHAMGQHNYPRTVERQQEAFDKYIELFTIVSDKIRL